MEIATGYRSPGVAQLEIIVCKGLTKRRNLSSGCYTKVVYRVAYKQLTFIFHSPGDWKSELKVTAWLDSIERPVSGSQNSCHILKKKKESYKALWGPHYKVMNPSHEWEHHPHDLIISQRPYILITSHWGLGFQCLNLGAGRKKHSVNCRRKIICKPQRWEQYSKAE